MSTPLRLFVASSLLLWFAAPVSAQGEGASPRPLSRFVPSDDLIAYAQLDGIDAHAAAWKKTAAAKMLNETTLGALFEDLANQGLSAALAGAPPSVPSAPMIIDTFKAIMRKGIVVAVVGKDAKKPEVVIAVRGGAGPPLRPMVDMVFQYMTQTRGAAKTVTKAGRTITLAGDGDNERATWDEGDDRVICDPNLVDRVLAVLDGKEPNADKNPLLAELTKPETGFEPVAAAFINIAPFGPLPPEAVKLGLDDVKRVDFRIGFQDYALVTISRAIAAAPRKGILALVDQPGFTLTTLPPLPSGLTGFTVMSIDPAKTYDQIVALIKANDPGGAKSVDDAEKALRELLKMDLRRDVLTHMGPKVAIYNTPAKGGPEGVAVAMLDMRAAIQIDDPAAIGKALAPLMEAFNAQMRARPGQADGGALEFVKAEGPSVVYTMKIPPNPGIPPQLTGLEPTVMVGKDRLVIATRREGAEAALAAGAGGKGDNLWKPTEKFVAMADKLPKSMVFLNVNDPREMFPALISSLPFLVQSLNAAIQQASRGNPNQAPRVPIEVDPAKIPDPAELTRLLFPGSFALSADAEGIRVVTRDAFPSVTSPAVTGVAVALLLPAVQAAREAARRAQCTNNMKQIALAMHNYHSANNSLPKVAITDKDGKPLLSWRVAILPYIEQQALYNKFKLDEPWDSAHNKPLLDEMPPIYVCPSMPRKGATGTSYRVFVGNNALFENDRAVGFQDVTDGTSNTIMVVETRDTVPWSKPEEIPFDPQNKAPGFGAASFHPGGFNACFADGSVRFIKLSIAANVLRALITRNGGEVIAAGDF